jgi:hypothetical protein
MLFNHREGIKLKIALSVHCLPRSIYIKKVKLQYKRMRSETKVCYKCKIEKSKSEFYKDKSKKDGLRGNCKACACEYIKEYSETHKGAIRERWKAYYYSNTEILLAKRRAYYAENAESAKRYQKEYRAANAEAIAARKKEYYAANTEAILEYQKEYRAANAESVKQYQKEYRIANAETLSKQRKEYYEANKEAIRERGDEYRKANKEAIIKKNAKYTRSRIKTDMLFALTLRIRTLIGIALAGKGYSKKSKTYEILGCTYEEFYAHIESQFPDGMGWHNRGEWHLDHIYPVSKAVDEAHLIKLNQYTNFQPLWAEDNIRKGNKIPEESAA